MAMYSFGSTKPCGADVRNVRSVSRARRASSCVGEFGVEPPRLPGDVKLAIDPDGGDVKELRGEARLLGVVVDGGAMDELLLR